MTEAFATDVRPEAHVDAALRCDLARALEDANVPVLVTMLAHLTDDRRWIEAPYRVDREVGSWYRNSARRVVANSPWRLVDYWNMTRELNVTDWTFEAPR